MTSLRANVTATAPWTDAVAAQVTNRLVDSSVVAKKLKNSGTGKRPALGFGF
jgi:hypothetical protein